MILPIVEARAEILQKIRLLFGRFEDSKISFWNYLTFSKRRKGYLENWLVVHGELCNAS